MWTVKKTLRERINGLSNGWDREADSILQEIGLDYTLQIGVRGDNKGGRIGILQNTYSNVDSILGIQEARNLLWVRKFNNQCEKNQVFKQALLWILEGKENPQVGTHHEVEIAGQKHKVQIVHKI